MSASKDLPEFEFNPERVDALKRLRKGVGMGREVKDFPYDLFEVSNSLELLHLVIGVMPDLPAWRSADAILLALNVMATAGKQFRLGEPRPLTQLTERREQLAAKWEVHLRTVIRFEERGAQLLDYYIGRQLGRTVDDAVLRADGEVSNLERAFKKEYPHEVDTLKLIRSSWQQAFRAVLDVENPARVLERERSDV